MISLFDIAAPKETGTKWQETIWDSCISVIGKILQSNIKTTSHGINSRMPEPGEKFFPYHRQAVQFLKAIESGAYLANIGNRLNIPELRTFLHKLQGRPPLIQSEFIRMAKQWKESKESIGVQLPNITAWLFASDAHGMRYHRWENCIKEAKTSDSLLCDILRYNQYETAIARIPYYTMQGRIPYEYIGFHYQAFNKFPSESLYPFWLLDSNSLSANESYPCARVFHHKRAYNMSANNGKTFVQFLKERTGETWQEICSKEKPIPEVPEMLRLPKPHSSLINIFTDFDSFAKACIDAADFDYEIENLRNAYLWLVSWWIEHKEEAHNLYFGKTNSLISDAMLWHKLLMGYVEICEDPGPVFSLHIPEKQAKLKSLLWQSESWGLPMDKNECRNHLIVKAMKFK